MVKDYVLVWRSDISPGTIKLVGPFDGNPRGKGSAETWGRIWQKAHQDNPCWQVISLDDNGFTTDHFGHYPSLILNVAVPGTPGANL